MKKIVAFGELLVRLTTPGRQLLTQAQALDIHIGGAEANVLVGLSSLGHAAAMVSAVPANALGQHAIASLRARGVDTRAVLVGGGRMGLYFLSPGAGLRASEIIYDRAGSSFALASPDDFDWPAHLEDAELLHLSGITPALGPKSAAAALGAARAAKAAGVPVSFDGNYRAMLWEAWDSDPKSILTEMIRMTDILFGNHRDISLVLGQQFSGDGEDRRRDAAKAAFAAFPSLKLIASTARHVVDADHHRISARVDLRESAAQTREVAVTGIVDRIGAGDAFAAGVLHAHLQGGDAEAMAETGLALTCLKHSLSGDASLFGKADIYAFMSGNLDVRR